MSDRPKTEPLADEELQEVTGGAAIPTNAFGARLVAGVDENDTGQTSCLPSAQAGVPETEECPH